MKKEITKGLLENLYIKQKKSTRELMQILQVGRKCLLRLLKKYGLQIEDKQIIEERKLARSIEKYGQHYSKNEDVRKKMSEKKQLAYSTGIPQQKYKETCLNKYGVTNTSKLDSVRKKIKATVNKNYLTGEPQQKRFDTMLKNGTLYQNTSREEDQVYDLLSSVFDKTDIIRSQIHERYPFKCDFYIPSLDLFIEYNGSHYHGKLKEPFDPNNPNHIEELNRLEQQELAHKSIQKTQYSRMIKVWTKEDPYKREIAKKNGLNFKEFWSIEEVKSWLNSL